MGSSGLLCLISTTLVLLPALAAAAAAGGSLEQKCGQELLKLQDCLAYAKEQAKSPSDKCCEAAKGIRATDPACLCYVIQQTTSDGQPQIRQLGLKPDRLVQLPNACHIPDSNITNCPKLLGLSPSSPAYAIFNGSATSNTTSAGPNSAGSMNRVRYTCAVASAIASAIVFSVFSL